VAERFEKSRRGKANLPAPAPCASEGLGSTGGPSNRKSGNHGHGKDICLVIRYAEVHHQEPTYPCSASLANAPRNSSSRPCRPEPHNLVRRRNRSSEPRWRFQDASIRRSPKPISFEFRAPPSTESLRALRPPPGQELLGPGGRVVHSTTGELQTTRVATAARTRTAKKRHE